MTFSVAERTSVLSNPIFTDNTNGILGLHWARHLGKSTVFASPS